MLIRRFLALALVLALAAAVAQAQIEPTSPARQRAANRRALREASRTEAPYKESHLAVTRQQLTRGASVSRAPAPEPKRPGLRLRKPKVASFR